MTKEKSKSAGNVKTDARRKRLEDALKANLKKRKQQTRERGKKGDT